MISYTYSHTLPTCSVLRSVFHEYTYEVATISRLLKIIGLLCRISSLLWGSFAKRTCNFKEPTTRSQPLGAWLCNILYFMHTHILSPYIPADESSVWSGVHMCVGCLNVLYSLLHKYTYSHTLHTCRWVVRLTWGSYVCRASEFATYIVYYTHTHIFTQAQGLTALHFLNPQIRRVWEIVNVYGIM